MLEEGFPLRKWASNCPEVLKNVPNEHLDSGFLELNVESKSLKTLGNYWHPLTDTFSLERVSVHRWLPNCNGLMELHGFCDASESAYAAVVYARMIMFETIQVVLIASKTKVAPVNCLFQNWSFVSHYY